MTPIARAGFLARARTAAYQRRVAQALALLERMAGEGRRPYVAVSGGKDSTVCLDICRRVWPDAPAVHSHDEWLLPETEAYLASIPGLVQVAGPCQHTEWFTSWASGPSGLPAGIVWVDAEWPSHVWAKAHGCDLVILGLRAAESAARRQYLGIYGDYVWVRSTAIYHGCPVAWWTTADIWAYIVSRDLPYNRAYDRLGAMGVPLERQRIGPFAVEGVLELGQLRVLAQGWPEVFRRFAARYPAARLHI